MKKTNLPFYQASEKYGKYEQNLENLKNLENSEKLKKYRERGWYGKKLPQITSYKTQEELRNVVKLFLNPGVVPRAETTPSRRERENRFALDDWLRKNDVFILYVSAYEEEPVDDSYRVIEYDIYIYFVSKGWYVESVLHYGDIEEQKLCLEVSCVESFLDRKEIESIHLRTSVKSSLNTDFPIYQSRFPLDYFIENEEVSKEQYFAYQNKLLREESSRYTLPEISGLIESYFSRKE